MKPEVTELVKKEYHHLDSIFLNSAYFGPSPYRAKQKVSRALQKELDPSFFDYNTWMGISERIREQLAKLLDCPVDNVCHSTSTSDVINIIANGLNLKSSDIVCSINKDYPSNVLPWMLAAERGKLTYKLLDLEGEIIPSVEWLSKTLPKETKVFNVSHVTFDTGKKVDILGIGKLCKERGILFVVDATQSLGGMPITKEELEVIDILACSSYKWILGPYGHAFAYFSDHALQKVQHQNANWISSPNSKVVYNLLDYTTETLPGARKFDRGQASNMLTMSCLEASIEFLNEIGLSEIQHHNEEVRDYFLDNIPNKDFQIITPKDHMANIVALKAIKADPISLERELKYRNVDVSIRQGNIRLSFHIFNNKDHVDELLKALEI